MKIRWVATIAILASLGLHTQAQAQILGTAASFAVLAGSTVTNTGPTVTSGNVGVWPGTAIVGFPPGIVTNGTIHAGNMVAQQAQTDLTTAYNTIAGEAFTQDLTGQDLGGLTLYPGVYHFSSSAFLTGTLTLDALGDPNARFDFQIGSTLITASGAVVNMINGGDGCNVHWQVGSSATLGTATTFTGHILALTSITLTTGATIIDGSALARNGAVTLDSNAVSACMVDTESPMCAITAVTSTYVQVTGQDTGSGLASIEVVESSNLTVSIPAFTVGTTNSVTLTATKINVGKSARLVVRIQDVRGNATLCDPIVANIVIGPRAKLVVQNYGGIPQAESIVTLINGSPGISRIWLSVNGRLFTTTLEPGQRWVVNVASAMRKGSRNRMSIRALGRARSTALLVIGDSMAP